MKSRANESKIALYIPATVTTRSSSEFRTLSPYFVAIHPDGEIRNIYWSYTDGEQQFENLRFYCQWGKDRPQLESYGWRLEYHDVDIARADRALRMARMLRRAERAHNAFLVAPTSFGQYVTLLAAGLGVKRAVIPTSFYSGYSYPDVRHQFLKIGEESQRAIDHVMQESWKADHPEALTLGSGSEVVGDAN